MGIISVDENYWDEHEIATRFVQDRLEETPWGKRDYIVDLNEFANTARRGGPRGFASSLAYGSIKNSYPVEAACILKEIEEGVYTPPEEFRRVKKEHSQQIKTERQEEEATRTAKQESARKKWLEIGGQP